MIHERALRFSRVGAPARVEYEEGGGPQVSKNILAAVDVAYNDLAANAACILFERWEAMCPYDAYSRWSASPRPYISGRFHQRELPCLLGVLELLPEPPAVVVVDGFVWLGADGKPGLGAHLYEALGNRTAVIGVAKNRYRDSLLAKPVLRGQSSRPLWVTAAGMDVEEAARFLRLMHGGSRIPTLLQIVDARARRGSAAS
jgi:deoxyribonuclease V